MTDKVDAVVAALMEWQYSNVSLEASFRKHGLLPAPAPSLRWPGVEVVKAEDGRWDARTDAHFLYVDDGDGVRMWWKRTHGGDASGMFGHRIDALSALNDPRTPPPPHVAEGKEGDDGMESRCSDFRRTKGEAHSEREIALACSFASSEVTRATAALTAERDRLAAEKKRRDAEAREARKAAAAPDADKLRAYAKAIGAIKPPTCSTQEGRNAVMRIEAALEVVLDSINLAADEIGGGE